MQGKERKRLSALLISVLVSMSAMPHLNTAAALQERQISSEEVLTGDNGTRYDRDYDPYIWDEEASCYEEDSEEYQDFVRDYYGKGGIFTAEFGRQPSLASASNLASPADLASMSDWEGMWTLASPADLATASDAKGIPETVAYTDAGPFLAPVLVGGGHSRMRQRAGIPAWPGTGNENGLVLDKTVEYTEDPGIYQIRLEAYLSSSVTAIDGAAPADIVLVLDQSQSMARDFEGDWMAGETESRQYAMKQAVSAFIRTVGEKYHVAGCDHRMALVAFGEKASVLRDWTLADEAGTGSLLEAVDELDIHPSQATDVAGGMKAAENLMGSGYQYTGDHTHRQKVVIVVTDGIPTKQYGFETDLADEAIRQAKQLKDMGCTVYSAGLFAGANPDELFGDSWRRLGPLPDTLCTGEVGSCWGGSWMSVLLDRNDFADMDIAAGNRFLNYLSTNSEDAEGVGIVRDLNMEAPWFGTPGPGYRITENYSCENKGYYLTADDSVSLNEIFIAIGENICASDGLLSAEAVVDDVISPYFELLEDERVTVTTAEHTGGGSFGGGEACGLVPELVEEEGRQHVTVTGFPFDENYVSKDGGRKLIVEYRIRPRKGFLGGNGVPVSDAESGIYDRKDGGNELAGSFEVPVADVPIPDITVEALPRNVYLKNTLTEEGYKEGMSVRCGDVPVLGEGSEMLEEWQAAYVRLPDRSEVEIVCLPDSPDGDRSYALACVVTPRQPGTETAKAGRSEAAAVCVYKPVITFHDSEIFYGEELPDPEHCDNNRSPVVVWKHGDLVKAEDTVMSGEEPQLCFAYQFEPSGVREGRVNARDILPVRVTKVTAGSQEEGEENYLSCVTWVHQDCDGRGGSELEAYPGYHFLFHVRTGTLTICQRTEEGDTRTQESFVYTIRKDGKPYTSCTVPQNGEITISGLPVGDYELEGESGRGTMAWRYGRTEYGDSGNAASLSEAHPDLVFTCTNKKVNAQWLNGSDRRVNERKAEGLRQIPLAADAFAVKGVPEEEKEWLGYPEDTEKGMFGRGMRNKPAGGEP